MRAMGAKGVRESSSVRMKLIDHGCGAQFLSLSPIIPKEGDPPTPPP